MTNVKMAQALKQVYVVAVKDSEPEMELGMEPNLNAIEVASEYAVHAISPHDAASKYGGSPDETDVPEDFYNSDVEVPVTQVGNLVVFGPYP